MVKWCWTWTRPRFRSTASRSRVPTTGISSRAAITRCCCSIARVTHLAAKLDRATCTAPMTGKNFSCRRSSQQKLGKEVVFRADAAFAKPEIYEALEEREVKYAIRIPANDSLQRDIEELLKRPVGRPSKKAQVESRAFSKPRVGRQHAGWWPRWSITQGNCSRE